VKRLEGRRALVTGAAGGIGSAAARRLAEEGAEVVLADRDGDSLDAVVAALREQGHRVHGAVCDQTRPEDVERLFGDVVAGRLDICFANAGYGRPAPVLDQDLAQWQRHLDVNLTGTFLICQGAARAMVGNGGGSIIVNASTAALRSTALFGAYAASKAGIEMLARSMADELGASGIRVNTVCPGTVETGMTDALLNGKDGQMRALVDTETPLGRVGTPEDIAGVVAFLAGDDSAYVTGTALLVDGGQTIRGFPRWFVADAPNGSGPRWRPIAATRSH
jgi:NAD(P)-dependent dehydrogenase (short-subunit alcohol dehydrogenase family)